MSFSLPSSPLRGTSQSPYDKLAQGLGYFSIGLGLAELLAPRSLSRLLNMEGHETLIQAYGAREIATGVAILTSHDPTPWIWGRVAGDVADLATVGTANHGEKPENVTAAFVALLGVTVLDVICASGLTAEKSLGGPEMANRYSDRSGFPRNPRSMRGAASEFDAPKDMRIPPLLRPYATEKPKRRRPNPNRRVGPAPAG